MLASRKDRSGITSAGKQPGTTMIGEKLFSETFMLKSDVGNPILRQTPIGTDGMAARPVTWTARSRTSPTTARGRDGRRRSDADRADAEPGDGRLRHHRRTDDQDDEAGIARHVLLVSAPSIRRGF